MFLMSVLAGVHRRRQRQRACILRVSFVLLAILPLAHDSPPDPVSLAGIYDAGDSDDVTLAATSLASRVVEGVDVFGQVSLGGVC